MGIAPSHWGVLIYSSASPDIEPACRASLAEALEAARSDGVELAAQLGTATEVRRVCPRAQVDETSAPQDMSQRATLENFLRWGMKAVPAERYLVVLGGHGSGFMGAVTDSTRQRIMRPQDMRAALQDAGMHADVLVLNSCLQANAEVALELAPQADYLVASQGLQAREGTALGAAIARLRADTLPIEAARVVVDASAKVSDRTPLLSAVDERRLPALAVRLDELGAALLADDGALAAAQGHFAAMRSFREDKPWDRPLVDLKDLREMAGRLASDERLRGTAVEAAARAADESARQAVIAHHGIDEDGASRADAHGISLYLPTRPLGIERAQRQYDSLALSASGHWHEALRRISEAG